MTTIILAVSPITILEGSIESKMEELETRTAQYELAILLGLEDVLDPNFQAYAETMGEIILEELQELLELQALYQLEADLGSIMSELQREDDMVEDLLEMIEQVEQLGAILKDAFEPEEQCCCGHDTEESEDERLARVLSNLWSELPFTYEGTIDVNTADSPSDDYLERVLDAIEGLYPEATITVDGDPVQYEQEDDDLDVVFEDTLSLDPETPLDEIAGHYLDDLEERHDLGGIYSLDMSCSTDYEMEYLNAFSNILAEKYPHIKITTSLSSSEE